MAQHYKNDEITISRLKTFIGWENLNPKGNVAPGRMDQNVCGRLWENHQQDSIVLSKAESVPVKPLSTPGLLQDLKFAKAAVGDSFGPTWSTHLFRLDIEIPAAFEGKEVHLIWNSNSEAMVLNDAGHPRQGLVGGDGMCRRADYSLFGRPAETGESLTLYIQVACNGLFGAGRGGDIEPPDPDRFYTLAECSLAVFNPPAWNLISDLTVMLGLAEDLPRDSPRRSAALLAANSVVNAVEVDDPDTYAAGLELAKRFLTGARNGGGQSTVYTQLHSHIDLAWLWPMSATPGKAARTFSSKLRLLEGYPEAIFVQSQAQLYEWVKNQYPTLYAEIKTHVAGGRFVPVGGTWVEMDCNLPCGESLVRQFTEGQSFFSSEFGIHCEEFWLPDTFGYPAQLPQLMRLSGITRFLTQKLSWNLFNKFPHSTFVWQGLDAGPGVVTHFPPADTYNAIGSPAEVIKSARGNKDAGVFNSSVMLVGHGDGGGGASPAMIECINRMRDVDGVPKVKFATPGEFFEAVEEKRAELPRWQMSELYFELHRGTFTAQAGIKRDNFECEVGLLLTETLSAFAMLQKETSFCYPEDELRRLWRLVLLNQFHDTLPGSSIGEVYREAAAMHKEVLAGCKVLDKIALKMLCGGSFFSNEPAVALNGNGSRAAAEKCPGVFWPTGGAESVGEGTNVVLAIPRKAASDELLGSTISQMTDGEEVLVAVKRPTNGIGVSKLDGSLLSETQVGRVQAREEGGVGFVLENSVARVVIRSGIVQSFVLVGTGGCPNREVIPEGEGGGNQFWLYDDVPMFWDAWDVEVYNFEKRKPISTVVSCKLVETGPLRASVQVEYALTRAGTTITQTISLQTGSPRLEFQTKVDWKESRKLLRVEFPTSVRSPTASYGTQFGWIGRPTTFNTRRDIAQFEVVAHGFGDLSEYGFGVALLTGGSKYGMSARNNVLRLSLLKSSKSPDENADIGAHEFRYGLLPHAESFPCKAVMGAAASLSRPPLPITLESTTEPLGVELAGLDSVAVSAFKRADGRDDALVVRLYEALGGRGEARVSLPMPPSEVKSVALCDLLEREMDDGEDTVRLTADGEIAVRFAPFTIRSVLVVLN